MILVLYLGGIPDSVGGYWGTTVLLYVIYGTLAYSHLPSGGLVERSANRTLQTYGAAAGRMVQYSTVYSSFEKSRS